MKSITVFLSIAIVFALSGVAFAATPSLDLKCYDFATKNYTDGPCLTDAGVARLVWTSSGLDNSFTCKPSSSPKLSAGDWQNNKEKSRKTVLSLPLTPANQESFTLTLTCSKKDQKVSDSVTVNRPKPVVKQPVKNSTSNQSTTNVIKKNTTITTGSSGIGKGPGK